MECAWNGCELEAVLMVAMWPTELLSENETVLRSEVGACLDHVEQVLPGVLRGVMIMNGLMSPETPGEWQAWAQGMSERAGDDLAMELQPVGKLECDTHGFTEVNSEGACIACISGFDYI